MTSPRPEGSSFTRDPRYFEPGRFLVAPAGTYLARVVDRKMTGSGHHVVIFDGGIHQLLRPALTGQPHRVHPVGACSGPGRPAARVTVAGALCSGLDVLAAGVEMDPPDPGDLIAVLDAGAYGSTESMRYFLSHPIPAESRSGTAMRACSVRALSRRPTWSQSACRRGAPADKYDGADVAGGRGWCPRRERAVYRPAPA